MVLREATKKSFYLNGRAIKRGGGGGKGRAIKEKITFFGTFFSNVPKFQRPFSSRGGGKLDLNGPAIMKRTFFAVSLTSYYNAH